MEKESIKPATDKPENSLSSLLKEPIKVVSLLSIIFYISGFLIWNLYLANLSLSEFNIIQTKFILSGAVFCIEFILLVGILFGVGQLVSKTFKEIDRELIITWLILLFFIALYFYSNFVFMKIPSKFGGGQPQMRSIIGSESEINFLEPFLGKASPIQTNQFCLAYESDEKIIILRDNRVIELKQTDVSGFVTVPSKEQEKLTNEYCSALAFAWVNNKPEK